MVAHNSLVIDIPKTIIPKWIKNTVRTGTKFGEKDFVIRSKETTAQALVIS